METLRKRLEGETECVSLCVVWAHITSATTAKSSCGRLLAGLGSEVTPLRELSL